MSYILKLQLHKATDLPAADMSLTGGKSDPYVIFSLGNESHRTPCVSANLDPVWSNETFQFRVPDLTATLRLEIWDDDKLRKDDLLGTIDLPLSTVPRGLSKNDDDAVRAYEMRVDPQFASQHVSSMVWMSIALLTPEEAVAVLDFEVWENERWSVMARNWSKKNLGASERKEWSTRDGTQSSSQFEDVIPVVPPSYERTNTWHYVKHPGDKDGWIYAPSFDGPWYDKSNMRCMVRRRRWINSYARSNNYTF
ncbi:C2 domain-containing protein [Achlya hypogyna]|uniref:C2 domain-containing protein n=1 Tax=Achlya hypogyna TaxID=1202772 RepID=A0A1V9ZR03_ACHHY|nr:C2 domain-containing protein [Achlya hypogyna]